MPEGLLDEGEADGNGVVRNVDVLDIVEFGWTAPRERREAAK